jgi:hypothetical protein
MNGVDDDEVVGITVVDGAVEGGRRAIAGL